MKLYNHAYYISHKRRKMGSFLKKESPVGSFLAKISEECVVPFSGRGRLLPLVLILLCLGMNIYVRLFPAYFPQLREQAVLNVINRPFSGEADPSVLNGANGDSAENRAATAAASAALDGQIREEYEKIKDPYQSPNGITYLLENDPYVWAQYTEDVIKHGHPGDKKMNGKSYDSFILAPRGGEAALFPFFFFAAAYIYKILNFFKAVPLERYLFFIPVFYAFVVLLTYYVFVRRWSTDLAAFLATFLAGLAVFFINRSCAGWYDLDALNLFLSLAITGLLLEALHVGSYNLKWLFFTLLAAFFQGVFMTAWMGWWFILLILFFFFSLSFLSLIVHHYKEPRRLLRELLFYGVTGAGFFVVADFSGYRFSGIHLMASTLNWAHALYPKLGTSLSQDIWPNPLYTISEMASLKLWDVGRFFYNRAFFVTAVVGLCVLAWKDRNGKRKDVTLMMLCWFVFLTVAAMKSNRFVLFLYLPAFFFLGVFLGDLLPTLISSIVIGWRRLIATLAFVLGLAFLVFCVGGAGIETAESIYPLMDDSWYKALTYIDQHTPKEAILNSWWDNGNWFKYYGKRRVIFDPQTQQGQLAYWMGRVFLEKDEARAVAILRMLNNASTATFRELRRFIPHPYQCERVLERLLKSDRPEGERILGGYQIPGEAVQRILGFLHNKPAPAYFIVDRELTGKIANISFLGNWDFPKAFAFAHRHEARKAVVSALVKDFDLTPKKAEWVAEVTALSGNGSDNSELFSTRSIFFLEPKPGRKAGHLTYFDNGVVSDQDSDDVLFYDAEAEKYHSPRKVIFYETGVARVVENDKGDYDKTVVVIRDPQKSQAFIADDQLAVSLLVKLYFLRGAGLRFFKPFYSDDVAGIYIYEIVWEPV